MQKSLPLAASIAALVVLSMPCGAATPVLNTLYSFPGEEGAFPEAGLVINNGSLFGTTYAGGTAGWGTVFELSPPTPPATAWTFTQLYSFTGGSDGANPRASLVFSTHGVIFGTTEQGGQYGYGSIFSLTLTSGTWVFQTVYSFEGAPAGCGASGPICDGAYPEAGLVQSPKSGLFYGTTYGGGSAGYGTVFQLTPPAPPSITWTEKPLWSFLGSPSDGANPLAGVTFTSKGALFGTTYAGGGVGWGTVFELTQSAGVWSESVLHSFNGAPSSAGGGSACGTSGDPTPCDGGAPAGNVLVNATTGVLTGTTTLGGNPTACNQINYEQGCGTVFQLTPPVAPSTTWTESLIYIFGPPQSATLPSFNLASPPAGTPIFGTAFTGASSASLCFPESYTGCGMVYMLRAPTPPATTWTFNTLAVFSGGNGGGPNGVLLQPGILYGTTYEGGIAGGYGTVFQLIY